MQAGRRLRVGVIGCGAIAQAVHLPALARIAEAEVVALAESDADRLRSARRWAPEAAAFDDSGRLLAEAAVDAVVITLPSALHAAAAKAALERGVHVYLEKPVATALADARELVAVWRASGRVGMMGFNFRFGPFHAEARRTLQDGTLGEVIAARTTFAVPRGDLPAWKQTRASGGGVLLEQGSHHFDLPPFLFGRQVECVSAEVRSRVTEGDTAFVQLTLEGGLPMQSFFCLGSAAEDRLEIFGTRGRLAFDRFTSLALDHQPANRATTRVGALRRRAASLGRASSQWRRVLRPSFEPSYAVALARFVAAARAGTPCQPDLADGLRSLAVVCAAEESARLGRPVQIERWAP